MQPDPGRLHQVAWRELFPWLLLFRTFRLAVDARKLILAAAALVLTSAGWWGIGKAFQAAREDDPHLAAGIDAYSVWPWDEPRSGYLRDLAAPESGTPLSPAGVAALGEEHGLWSAGNDWRASNPLFDPWRRLSSPVRRLFDARLRSPVGLAFFASCALWALLVWTWFGGAITRLAAVELAREDRLSWAASFRYVRAKWPSYLAAPLLPLAGVVIGVVLMLPLGLGLRADVGALVLGLFWPLALLGGLILTIFLVGLLFGWPLMWAAMSVEGMDSWDALSRAFAYVYQRPLEYLFYAVVSAVLGALGWVFVSAFASAVVYVALWGVSWSSGDARIDELQAAVPEGVPRLGWPDQNSAYLPASGAADVVEGPGTIRKTAAMFIACWSAGVRLLALGFVYSYFWCAATGIYFLLRRDADATPLDVVQFDEPQEPHGLPPLKPDAAGVPLVDEGASAQPPAGAEPPATQAGVEPEE